MPSFDVIAAISLSRGIGNNNRVPWQLPRDTKFFKKTTTHTNDSSKQNAVIMGRNTWESLPDQYRPLPGRLNVVLTRQESYQVPEGVLKAKTFNDALEQVSTSHIEHIFVVGGEQIYKEALQHPDCQDIYLTHIQKDFPCDTFFPPFPSTHERTYMSNIYIFNDIPYYFSKYTVKKH